MFEIIYNQCLSNNFSLLGGHARPEKMVVHSPVGKPWAGIACVNFSLRSIKYLPTYLPRRVCCWETKLEFCCLTALMLRLVLFRSWMYRYGRKFAHFTDEGQSVIAGTQISPWAGSTGMVHIFFEEDEQLDKVLRFLNNLVPQQPLLQRGTLSWMNYFQR